LIRYWTDEEHQKFLDALQVIGPKDVKAIAAFVGTRSATQVRTHAQKFFLKLVITEELLITSNYTPMHMILLFTAFEG
jgi:SHAQKYF class myb-like DNA-binding protein